MNTLIFIAGTGLGSLIATLLLIGVMRVLSRNSADQQKRAIESNERSADLLEDRNAIGERQVKALEAIAINGCPHTFVTHITAEQGTCDRCGGHLRLSGGSWK